MGTGEDPRHLLEYREFGRKHSGPVEDFDDIGKLRLIRRDFKS